MNAKETSIIFENINCSVKMTSNAVIFRDGLPNALKIALENWYKNAAEETSSASEYIKTLSFIDENESGILIGCFPMKDFSEEHIEKYFIRFDAKKTIKPNALNLTKIDGFVVMAADDEHASNTPHGYYKSEIIAKLKAIGAGWWGYNGTAEPIELYVDKVNDVYVVNYLGKFADKDPSVAKGLVESIKAKLTPAEQELLGL